MAVAGKYAKVLARMCLHRLGIVHALSWYQRSRFLILTYHRFSQSKDSNAAEELAQQCAYLRRYFTPVSMSEIGNALRDGTALPSNAVAVTVDDGYCDFKSVAAPVFAAYGIPATVFLIADFMDGRLWPWWDHIAYALHHTTRSYVEVPMNGAGQGCRLPTKTEAEREAARNAMIKNLTHCPDRLRVETVSRLAELFDTEIPNATPPEYAAMSWDDVRALELQGFEFGAHTASHPILPSVEDKRKLRGEIAGSKSRIEQEMHHPVSHFAYPNGDFDEAVVDEVASAGFQTAVTVMAGLNSRNQNRYLLHRFCVETSLPHYYFKEILAGLHS